MFSKELENLIQATLEDGVLEEYEKAALLKRAQAEGVDSTELQIYINSILQRRQRERAEAEDAKQAEIDRKKKEAVGRICPQCQRPVPPMTIRCQCGYEFVDTNRLSSVQILFEKLNSITLTEAEEEELKKESNGLPTSGKREKIIARKKMEIIKTFPVPNTKEDIIEFCALALPNSKRKGGFLWGTPLGRCIIVVVSFIVTAMLSLSIDDPDWRIMAFVYSIILVLGGGGALLFLALDMDTLKHNKLANVWRAKFEQVMIKGRSLRGDAEFTQQLDYYESLFKQQK